MGLDGTFSIKPLYILKIAVYEVHYGILLEVQLLRLTAFAFILCIAYITNYLKT